MCFLLFRVNDIMKKQQLKSHSLCNARTSRGTELTGHCGEEAEVI
jgi:hypothetical protein